MVIAGYDGGFINVFVSSVTKLYSYVLCMLALNENIIIF